MEEKLIDIGGSFNYCQGDSIERIKLLPWNG